MTPPRAIMGSALGTSPRRFRRLAVLLAGALMAFAARGADYVRVPSGSLVSALAADRAAPVVAIAPFAMRVEPVTNDEYLAFVRQHPEWRRGQVSSLLAGPQYLAVWQGALLPGAHARPRQPVTDVSWFAARAFCDSEHARLPTWYEWEYVAAADAVRRDARRDPARNQALLSAVLSSTGELPGVIGQHPANVYGVRDINRLLWEWTADYAAMFANADTRVPGAGAVLALCGGSALAFADKNQYALIMRVAALTALQPADAAPRVGFRCVRELRGE